MLIFLITLFLILFFLSKNNNIDHFKDLDNIDKLLLIRRFKKELDIETPKKAFYNVCKFLSKKKKKKILNFIKYKELFDKKLQKDQSNALKEFKKIILHL
jgi:hypothetical protein